MKKITFSIIIIITTVILLINASADDTTDIMNKGYILHLDSTQLSFSNEDTTKTINYSIKINGTGSISKVNYVISSKNINMIDKHNLNNKIPVTITGGSSGILEATKGKAANTVLTTGSFTAISETTTKAGEYVGKATINMNLSYKCETAINTTWTFNFKNSEQSLIAPCKGTYKLETWGAQGGSTYGTGGYGGYSVGTVSLTPDTTLYIHTGGQPTTATGGYNGGGEGYFSGGYSVYFAGGGGATHIATLPGVLKNLADSKNSVLIISGGGGGSARYAANQNGGSAGGSGGGRVYYTDWGNSKVTTSNNYGATQTYSGKANDTGVKVEDEGGFGYGSKSSGAGYFGGAQYGKSNRVYSGAGGSGWIGNSLLSNKSMYCYNCVSSTKAEDKTTSGTCQKSAATADCAKAGSGYAKITLTSITT